MAHRDPVPDSAASVVPETKAAALVESARHLAERRAKCWRIQANKAAQVDLERPAAFSQGREWEFSEAAVLAAADLPGAADEEVAVVAEEVVEAGDALAGSR
jgi:hypothetical protein